MKSKHLNIFTDGGSRGNPGPAAIGVIIKDHPNTIIHQFGKTIGKTTNNVAEYQAVIHALTWILEKNLKIQTLHFFLDSNLVVNQLNGLWKIKDAHLKELALKTKQLSGKLKTIIKYTHIPREKNYLADLEVNKALDKS